MLDAETVSWVAVTRSLDAYGDGSSSAATAVEVQAVVAARSSSEPFNSRSPKASEGLTLYLLDTSVSPGVDDYFTVRGVRYDVDGPAHRWGSMGVEVAVRRAVA